MYTHLSILVYMYNVEVSDCDILRSSQFWNITYHDCENNHDYKILTIFDEKTSCNKSCLIKCNVHYCLGNYIPSNNDVVTI